MNNARADFVGGIMDLVPVKGNNAFTPVTFPKK